MCYSALQGCQRASAESTLNKDANAARAVSATVHSQPANAADNEKTCRAYAASFYRSVMLRIALESFLTTGKKFRIGRYQTTGVEHFISFARQERQSLNRQ
jgi:hypothetical protein